MYRKANPKRRIYVIQWSHWKFWKDSRLVAKSYMSETRLILIRSRRIQRLQPVWKRQKRPLAAQSFQQIITIHRNCSNLPISKLREWNLNELSKIHSKFLLHKNNCFTYIRLFSFNMEKLNYRKITAFPIFILSLNFGMASFLGRISDGESAFLADIHLQTSMRNWLTSVSKSYILKQLKRLHPNHGSPA